MKNRRAGNTLLLIVAIAFMFMAIAMIAICLFMAMTEQRRNESKLDSYALSIATGINGQDWIGEMNQLTGFSRELVYTSREALDQTNQEFPQLKPLALQLMDEARFSVTTLEGEKKTLLRYTGDIVKANVTLANKELQSKQGLKLPWVTTEAAQIQSVNLGYIDGVLSNATAAGAEAIPNLRQFDLNNKYFDERSGLFHANINAKLPEPDHDLNFDFASLPAPVKETISPACLASAEEFKTLIKIEQNKLPDFSKCKQLPSAVQVQALMKMSSSAGEKKVEGPVQVNATAACPGGTLRLP